MTALLETRDLTAFYGDFQALFGISLTVAAGETVAVIGANGAGKSTFLKSVAGLLPAPPGAISFDGADIGGGAAHRNVARGIGLVPEGRRLFPSLTVEENLRIGAWHRRSGRWTLARIYELFPMLAERRAQPATTLSGGQQQMCAIGRALMANPKMVLLDEPSMGLAPQIVEEVFEIVKDLNSKERVTFLLAEQNTNMALRYADYGYIMENGRIVMDGAAKSLAENEDVKEFYLGVGGGDRKSFKDVKSYKRRKRWLS